MTRAVKSANPSALVVSGQKSVNVKWLLRIVCGLGGPLR
jgi:hypothetical protein